MSPRNYINDLIKLPEADVLDWSSLHILPSICINLSQTSSRLFSFFKDEINVAAARKAALNLLRQLLSSAALGEWEKAEMIWKKFPGLLICRGTIYHPNRIYQNGQETIDIPFEMNPGRYKYVNCTAWQIALMNEEYDEAELMGKLMAEEEKQKQFAEIFPDGNIVKYNWDRKKAENLLDTVLNEVTKDENIKENDFSQMGEATKNALYALYNYVKPTHVHQAGLVFDINFYVKALQLYEERVIGQFKNSAQRSFWCIRVEEWLAACLGTSYLRPHAQGVGNELSRRGCVLADNSPYFAFRRERNFIPGYHILIGYFGRTWEPKDRSGGRAGGSFLITGSFKNYLEQNQKQRQNLSCMFKPPSDPVSPKP